MFKEITEKEVENFLHNIAWLRKQCGFSKKRMAALLEISIGTLNKIERAELPPRAGLKVLFTLCAYFDLHSSDLLTNRFDEIGSAGRYPVTAAEKN